MTAPRRALVSVADKTGLAELARGLAGLGYELVSTGSTAAAVRGAGVPVREVSDVTGFPEILDGRVKTLHPAVHAGILAERGKPTHEAALAEHGITPIDLVVTNLYPFERQPGIEMIDIGGPTLVRAAAKNHEHVGVVVRPEDYAAVLEELGRGGLSAETRRRLARLAFERVAAYDAAIAAWFQGDDDFPAVLAPAYRKAAELRYGENPHQRAAYYLPMGGAGSLGTAEQLGGKELSYNNLLDTDAAWRMALDFADPCVAIVKHTNPAGLAVAHSVAAAYPRALAGDPRSAFGGVVAVNRPLDGATARQIVEVFTEVVVAPGFDDEALDLLRTKANLRILAVADASLPQCDARTIAGGLLLQQADRAAEAHEQWTVATRAQPDEATLAELRFAWQACKHAKSNAIVLTAGGSVVGVGAGQMSRVDSVHLAVEKSRGRARGAALASDAFFPFRDGPDAAIAAGVTAIVQPGGSVRDEESVLACDEAGIPMVLTHRRHFRH